MIVEIDYNNTFENTILNLPKNVKFIKINNIDNINITTLCDILENTKRDITILNKDINFKIEKEFKKRNTYQGFNRSILNMVKKLSQENLTNNDYSIDMTIGNGYDTLFLAQNSKFVFGFDIQTKAILNTSKLLKENNINNVKLFKTSHTNITHVLKKYKHKIKLILFNLGYLPNGDKNVVTNHKSTLKALKKSINMLDYSGLILMVFYPHPEGKLEEKVILKYLNIKKIKYKIYKNTKKENSPYLINITPYK